MDRLPRTPHPRLERSAGCVVSFCPAATAMGTRVLRQGGNAVDAAVVTALALSVTRPQACGLGGGGLLVARARGGEVACLDFRETLPRNLHPRLVSDGDRRVAGALAVGVPGVVAGLAQALASLGSWTWERALGPAVDLAENGTRLTTQMAGYLALHGEALARFPSSRRVFAPGEPGSLWRQPDLAATLRALAADGPRSFYEGRVAARVVREIAAGGGVLDADDLAGYAPRWREPRRGRFLGREVITPGLPSRGGLIVQRALAALDGLGDAGSPARLSLLGRVFRDAFRDTLEEAGDPDRARGDCTTHLAAIDAQGGAASLTFSLNTTFGSKLTVDGAGFLLNNAVDDCGVPGAPDWFGLVHGAGNQLAPGVRPATSMSPALVLGEGGAVEVALGAAGGPRIPTTLVQILVALLHDGLRLDEAVAARRVHHQLDPDVLVVEDRVPSAVAGELARQGWPVERSPGLGLAAAAGVEEGALAVALDPRYRVD